MKNYAFNLKNKSVILTGGAGFLAKYFAEGLLKCQAKLIITDINKNLLEKRSWELKKLKTGQIDYYPQDISQKAAVKKILHFALKKYQKIDILINNVAAKNQHVSLSDWDKTLAVDLTSVKNCLEIIGYHMLKNGGGNIINIGSIYGLVSPKFSLYPKNLKMGTPSVYAASKAALIHLTRYYACLWAKKNVRVNCLSPGGVFNHQPMEFVKNYNREVPLGRMAKPEEIVGPLLFLCSPYSSYMTGANLVVDGGWTAW